MNFIIFLCGEDGFDDVLAIPIIMPSFPISFNRK